MGNPTSMLLNTRRQTQAQVADVRSTNYSCLKFTEAFLDTANSLPSQSSPLPSGRKGSTPKVRKKINPEPFWEIATVLPRPGGLQISRAFVVGQVSRLQTFLQLPSLFQGLHQLCGCCSLRRIVSSRVLSWPLGTARFGPAVAVQSAQLPATPVGCCRQPLGSAAPSQAGPPEERGWNRERPAQAPPVGVSAPRGGGVVGKREGARRGEGAKEAPASNLRAIEKEPARTSPKLVGTPGRADCKSGAERRRR